MPIGRALIESNRGGIRMCLFYNDADGVACLIASHRGFCAGVERAVETVERALEIYGPPVYVRKQIVHNAHVVRDLEARGVIFVESTSDVPEGGRLILAAHGVAPEVYREAGDRDLATIDATCPLVTKVHVQYVASLTRATR